jgi:hypothetical protein
MYPPTTKRVRTGSHQQSLKHKKSRRNVPDVFDACMYLPGVGSVNEYEWFVDAAPARSPEPSPVPAPSVAEQLLADPVALRSWLAYKQQQTDESSQRPYVPYFECTGALSNDGGAQ